MFLAGWLCGVLSAGLAVLWLGQLISSGEMARSLPDGYQPGQWLPNPSELPPEQL